MEFIQHLFYNTWSLLKSVSCWMIFSFLLSGILHEFLRPEILQRNLGNKRFSSLLKSTLSGALLPICSCGVVPLGMSLYYSGAYVGSVLAFIIATPIINPAAVLISLAMLGPELTLAYVCAGLGIPMIVGALANRFVGKELVYKNAASAPGATVHTQMKVPLWMRFRAGLSWGVSFLGKEICKYMIPGAFLAAAILTIIPVSFIQKYLSEPDMLSVLGAALLGAVMYVCAVGHIPFVAALIGAGAAPGIALTFLLTGTATNLPEIISLRKMIGKRTVILYVSSLVIFSLLAGCLVNLLLTDFIPVFDVSMNQGKLDIADKISITFPDWLEVGCAAILIGFFVWAYCPKLVNLFRKGKSKNQ